MNRLSWVLVVILIFGIIYAGSLTFVYVEGDDASSIAYHALGRDRALQPPYSVYHAGADLILSLLPAREHTLRVAAMTISSLAAICVGILMLALAFAWMDGTSVVQKWLVALVVLLASPELFYLGLVYTPSLIAMTFALAAHLLIRQAVSGWERPEKNRLNNWLKVALSAALFGFGGACRWDVLLYGGVIFADLIIGPGIQQADNIRRPVWNRSRLAVSWGTLALLAWGVVIAASGYGFGSISKTTNMAAQIAAEEHNYLYTIGAGQALFTPGFVALGLWGWFALPWQRKWLVSLAFVAMIGVIFGLGWRDPKTWIVFIPPMVLCVVSGFRDIWQGDRPVGRKRVLQAGTILLLLLPWIFGVRATYGDTAWGAGFELRPYDRPSGRGNHFALTIGAGAAFPTPEGPRPLFGHAAVLLGGGWRSLVRSLEEERIKAIQTAVQGGMPFMVIQGSTGYAVAELAGMGFTTSGVESGGDKTLGGVRHFFSDDGRQVTLWKLALGRPEFLKDAGHLRELIAVGGTERVVVHGYPSSLRTLYKAAPNAMQKLGPTTAIVDIVRVAESVAKQSESNEKANPVTK